MKNVLRRAAGPPSGVLPLRCHYAASRENSICLLEKSGRRKSDPFVSLNISFCELPVQPRSTAAIKS